MGKEYAEIAVGKLIMPMRRAQLLFSALLGAMTMRMTALVYHWNFRVHSLKSLFRNLVGTVSIAPVHETLIGITGDMKAVDAAKRLAKLERLGARAERSACLCLRSFYCVFSVRKGQLA